MAKTKVILTIDTEPSIAGAFVDPKNLPLIHQPVDGLVNGKSEALGFLTRVLQNHELRATFFVETCHTRYFKNYEMERYVERLCLADQDVQLHLHPSWLSFINGEFRPENKITDNCGELDVLLLTEIITEGCDLLESWTGMRPTGMRTGNFSTSLDVFIAMKKAKLQNSSNICLAVFRPPEKELEVSGGAHSFADIIELPVTCFSDIGPIGRGKLRPLQITALGASELINLLQKFHNSAGRVAVIVSHPFEFLKKKNYQYHDIRPNRLVQKRFEKLCVFLASNRDQFEVVSLQDASKNISVSEPQPVLSGSPIRSLVRAFENFTNDRV